MQGFNYFLLILFKNAKHNSAINVVDLDVGLKLDGLACEVRFCSGSHHLLHVHTRNQRMNKWQYCNTLAILKSVLAILSIAIQYCNINNPDKCSPEVFEWKTVAVDFSPVLSDIS